MWPSSVSRPYSRQPTHGAMLKSLEYAENTMEENALEYYENSNLAWRAQFTNPSLACSSIGHEFPPLKYGRSRERSSQETTQGDTDSENNQNGNDNGNGSATYRVYREVDMIEYLSDIDSDLENFLPLVDPTPH